jgi:transcriptional regulator with XRE-family HTH domain
VIDLVVFGKYLRGLRIRQDYEPADKLVADLESACGVTVSTRTIYAIERGEQLPRLDLLLALLVVLREDLAYFYPAFSDDIVTKLRPGPRP